MSNVDFVVNAEIRDDMGKGASRRLRHEGKVPAVIYGTGKDPVSLTLVHKDLYHHLENEAFYSHILTIDVAGKKEQAVLKDLQRHPAKPLILHADFLRVSANEKIRMSVPLHYIGEDVAPGVKIGGGKVGHNMNEVEISCLPKDLPEFIEVDMSAVELDQSVHLSDLKLPTGVESVELSHGPEHDLPVANIYTPRAIVEEEVVAAEGEAVEGEAAAEGEAEGEGNKEGE